MNVALGDDGAGKFMLGSVLFRAGGEMLRCLFCFMSSILSLVADVVSASD